ncbi:MAG: DUF2071 domain-containing protein [Phycisphaeraceae bacterium]
MPLPAIHGVIDRRMLVNYRVDPDAIARVLPPPFEPQLVDGCAIAGICLIRLKHIRPRLWPARCGIGSENAAHRIAVTWREQGEQRQGVYIPRRDTDHWLNTLAGGRLFPGQHHRARFDVRETDEKLDLAMRSRDGLVHLAVSARPATRWRDVSVFGSLDAASRFFEGGSCGYSPTRRPGCYEGIELDCAGWAVSALEVEQVRSSFFEDEGVFPPGSASFDCAMLMRNIAHQWRALAPLERAVA